MRVSINRESPIPIHDQLVTQLALAIASGALPPGRRLPSVRDMAGRLEVHRNTVSAVYKTLEAYGVVTIKAGSGVRVIDTKAEGGPSEAAARQATHKPLFAFKLIPEASLGSLAQQLPPEALARTLAAPSA